MGWPIRKYSPLHAASWMPRMWRSVDLPAPEGPMIDTNSPGLMSAAMRRSTNDCPAPTGYDFSTPRRDITGVFGFTSIGSMAADDDERLNSISIWPPFV